MQVGSKVFNVDPAVPIPFDLEVEIESIEVGQLPCSVINEVSGKKVMMTKIMPATWFTIKGYKGKFRKYSFETAAGWAHIKQLEEAIAQAKAEVAKEEGAATKPWDDQENFS